MELDLHHRGCYSSHQCNFFLNCLSLQEGLFTVIFGISAFFLLPQTPTQISFLTEEERMFAEHELVRDGAVTKDKQEDEFDWSQVRKAFQQFHLWVLNINGFLAGKP